MVEPTSELLPVKKRREREGGRNTFGDFILHVGLDLYMKKRLFIVFSGTDPSPFWWTIKGFPRARLVLDA